MIKNLNFYNANKIKAPYPIAKVDHFIDKKSCRKLCMEIDKFSDFDDLVMNGRFRVNKGSDNFKKYLKNSPYLFSLFKKLNAHKSLYFWFASFASNFSVRKSRGLKISWQTSVSIRLSGRQKSCSHVKLVFGVYDVNVLVSVITLLYTSLFRLKIETRG